MRKANFNTGDALLALKQGREEGLEFFFGQYYTPLCFFAASLLNDDCLAEEITSEAFLKLWEHSGQLNENAAVKSWLYTTVRNSCIDHLRKVKRLRVSEQGLQNTTAIEQSVLHTIVETETVSQIIQTLDILPPKCREVFQLHYIHGLSSSEIAAKLNVSTRTIRSHRQKALHLIRQSMRPLSLLILVSGFLKMF